MNDKSRDGEHLLSASIADTAGAKPIYQRLEFGNKWFDVPESDYWDEQNPSMRRIVYLAAPPAPSVADAASRSLGKWTITKPTNDGSCGYTTYETHDAKEARDAGMRGWGVAQHFELMPVDLHKEVAKLTFLLRTTPEKFDAETLMQLDSVEYGLECARNTVADAAGASEVRDQLYFALVGAESQLRQISKLMSEGHEFIDKGRTIEMWADMAKAAIAKESGND